jgi:hypothetical protein
MSVANNLVTTAGVDIFTAAAATLVKSIEFCNYDASNGETFTLYVIKSGGTAGDLTTVLKNYFLPAGQSYIRDVQTFLDVGDKIRAIASVSSTRITSTVNSMLM